MRLLHGRVGCVKTWLAVGLRSVVSMLVINTREPARWGQPAGWMKYVCQDFKPAIPCGSIYKHARSA
jgi:hypothetical protein